ncbi:MULTISPECIES: phage tailspike protein [Yersiniaceae]|uniref:phage tailspike protein n=1 Tax=Yersiniaceae TaxID=1903411 RepID=UPI0009354D9C|nr:MULTISPECIES: phage tailspike protein [Yersiniaceae]PLR38883.1 hypothetical protein CYR23_02195 [Chimaeribacter arupi]
MADITPNVVVSMPSQLFTAARAFKALAGGRIYLGKIDTDPTIAANRIQAYVENEDGSHIPIPQPILINLGGFPVYNGQVAKIVTVEGHSMAVYDLFGVQQFYFPNVLRYDPDQLRQQLNDTGDGYGDALIAVKQPYSFAGSRTQHSKNADTISAMDIADIAGDGTTNDTARFAALEAVLTGRVVNLAGQSYLVDAPPAANTYINGNFISPSVDTGNNVTLQMPSGGALISSTTDTGEYEARYQNPLTGDYQPSGRSTRDLYALIASQNSRSGGPSRAVNVGSIYSYSMGNVSGNYSARQCRATVPQSVNIGSEDCRVDGGFRGSNISSITSHVTGETGVNIGSRRVWATGLHAVNIASVDAYAGGGRGAVLKVNVNSNGTIASIAVVSAGTGYSANGSVAFYDRLSAPTTTAAATYTVDANGAITSVTLTNAGAGYSTKTESLFEVVQATILEAGNYSANIATANNCATYGELSFNLGANNSSAKASRSGNIAVNACSASGQYAVNIGSTSCVASATYSFNIGAATCNATGSNAGNIGATSSTASGAQAIVLGGGANIASGDLSAVLAGNNSQATASGAVTLGRRTINATLRSIAFGDSGSGSASTANTKFQVLSNGNVNIAGTLSQNVTFTDIAKMFENIEYTAIPVGSMVAWEGRKVRLAKEGDKEFSAHSRTFAMLLGDTSFTWADRYQRDEFGEIITGQVWDEEAGGWDDSINEGAGGYKGAYIDSPMENPKFDISKEQVKRSERRDEWTPVALLGEVHVRVDASVIVDGYVSPSKTPGLGTASENETRMRCMEIRTPYNESKGYAVALCLVR